MGVHHLDDISEKHFELFRISNELPWFNFEHPVSYFNVRHPQGKKQELREFMVLARKFCKHKHSLYDDFQKSARKVAKIEKKIAFLY